ncbi:hypothetical protein DITRI_Ditri04bG0196300 [Diplodiscus trichospermus]
MANCDCESESKQRALLVEWLNSILPNLRLPTKASHDELRASLIDGTVLCKVLNRLRPGLLNEEGYPENSSVLQSENVKRFLTAMDELGIPRFEVSDLEKGSMKTVVDCLLKLKTQFMSPGGSLSTARTFIKSGSFHGNASTRGPLTPLSGEERRKASSDLKLQRSLHTPLMSDQSALHHVGHKFHEVFQLKQGRYADLPATKISEMMKSNSLDNAPTQSLLSVVNGILDESIERKNGEIPHRVACLLRKVVQEIERRISTQADHLRTQNNLFKAREEKYQSRIKVLEALASGTGEENKNVTNQLQQIKSENSKVEEKQKVDEQEIKNLVNENDKNILEIAALKQELEIAKSMHKQRCLEKETETKGTEVGLEMRLKEQEIKDLVKENDKNILEIAALKQELEIAKSMNKQHCLEKETETKGAEVGLEMRLKELESFLCESNNKVKELESLLSDSNNKIKDLEALLDDSNNKLKGLESLRGDSNNKVKELESLLADSNNRVKELETSSESKCQRWNMKENIYKSFMDFQYGAVQGLRLTSHTIKQEILKSQKSYCEEFIHFEVKLKALAEAAGHYHKVLAENRKIFNELQDLKGNIRVYCRIRPFLPGQTGKQTIVESIGENGQLVVANPSKPGKDGQRSFKFNKVYGPAATQADVFADIQPFVQSVVDGYNVCIFAYGQTGSGKTYTMTGPNRATEEEWGVNYRALNGLFKLSQNRKSSIVYEVGVQMVEIYNEQVRDLLSSDVIFGFLNLHTLGITTISQPNGLAVPDATMQPVLSTSDVLDLMNIGLKNRAVSATAQNERSSRSHSIVTIHVRGKDLKAGSTLYGNLHLVDLAGSERVDRSEVTGDRLKEAQHINKSLSSLGDVIFALSQKSSHVPYRNSKLTQVLQSSLGGQAKTVMFVQLNPDVTSYSESMSTLKFAERVSGVELGAARSSKEGKDVRELMEQMASLKDTIAKKDEEIERLQLLKDLKNGHPSIDGEQHGTGSLRLLFKF